MAKKVNPALLALRRRFAEGFRSEKPVIVKCDDGGSLKLPASVPLGTIAETRNRLLALPPNAEGTLSGPVDGTENGSIGQDAACSGPALVATFDQLLFGAVGRDVLTAYDAQVAERGLVAALRSAEDRLSIARQLRDGLSAAADKAEHKVATSAVAAAEKAVSEATAALNAHRGNAS